MLAMAQLQESADREDPAAGRFGFEAGRGQDAAGEDFQVCPATQGAAAPVQKKVAAEPKVAKAAVLVVQAMRPDPDGQVKSDDDAVPADPPGGIPRHPGGLPARRPSNARRSPRPPSKRSADATKKYVESHAPPHDPAQRAANDPRRLIEEGLVQALKSQLPAEQAARYQEELTKRAASRKRLALRNLVARLDHDLVLSPDQRDKISESLAAHWDDSWGQSLGDVPVR